MPTISAVQVRDRNTVEPSGLVVAVVATATAIALPSTLSASSAIAATAAGASSSALPPTVSGTSAGLGNVLLGTAPLGA